MISGGGAGRKYLPNAKATNAIITPTIKDFVQIDLPKRQAQVSHTLPCSQTRQPFLAKRAPHSPQKLGRYIVGDSGFRWRDYSQIGARRNSLAPTITVR